MAAPVSSPHPRPPSSTHSRIPRHPRSYDNDFNIATHSDFTVELLNSDDAFYYDDLNRDSDGFVRPLANMNLGVDSQGNANPPTILKKFANAAGI